MNPVGSFQIFEGVSAITEYKRPSVLVFQFICQSARLGREGSPLLTPCLLSLSGNALAFASVARGLSYKRFLCYLKKSSNLV